MALEAQNNPFTSILMVGAADPEALPDADPSAGSFRIAIDGTGAAHIVDSTGTATPIAGGFSGDAGDVPFTPVGTIAGTDTQTAVAEVATDAASALSTHAALTTHIASGTSNPGSPTNGDLFYRSDLDLLIRYRSTGTRWVCTCLHAAPLNMQSVVIPLAATGSVYAGVDSTSRDLWIERVALATYIPSGTSDATRFWTITTLTQPAGTSNAHGTFDTKTDGNTATRHDLTTGAVMAAGTTYFEMIATKSSTVGNLYIFPGGIIYRYIVT